MEIRLLEFRSKEACLSGIHIEQEQRQYGNQDLKVNITSNYWTKEELIRKAGEVTEAADE